MQVEIFRKKKRNRLRAKIFANYLERKRRGKELTFAADTWRITWSSCQRAMVLHWSSIVGEIEIAVVRWK